MLADALHNANGGVEAALDIVLTCTEGEVEGILGLTDEVHT